MQMQTTTHSCTWFRPTKSLKILITKLYARFDGRHRFSKCNKCTQAHIFTWWILNWKQKRDREMVWKPNTWRHMIRNWFNSPYSQFTLLYFCSFSFRFFYINKAATTMICGTQSRKLSKLLILLAHCFCFFAYFNVAFSLCLRLKLNWFLNKFTESNSCIYIFARSF